MKEVQEVEDETETETETETNTEELAVVFRCEFKNCAYTTDRQDNMKRHQTQTHQKSKVDCANCGTTVSPSSLKRHMRSISCLTKKKKVSSIQPTPNDTTVIKVAMKVTNGSIEFKHDPIKIKGMEIILVPQIITHGKSLIKFVHFLIEYHSFK